MKRYNYTQVNKDLIDLYMSDQADKVLTYNLENSAKPLYSYSYLWQYRDYLDCCKHNKLKPNKLLASHYIEELKNRDDNVDIDEAMKYFETYGKLPSTILAEIAIQLIGSI
jgi:hypothetical protein